MKCIGERENEILNVFVNRNLVFYKDYLIFNDLKV